MCLLPTYSYLQSVEGGTKTPSAAKQETVDLSKFLYIVNSASCDLSQTSHMPNIITCLNRLRNSRVGPSGQITKLTTIKNALTFLLSRLPDDGGSPKDQNMVVRAKLVETKIGTLQKSLRKECSSIRLRKRDMFTYNKVDRDVLLKLLTNDQLLHLAKSYISKDTMTDQEQLLSRRFLMCSLPYQNAQRQGPVCNLKRSELSRATNTLLLVKTSTSIGYGSTRPPDSLEVPMWWFLNIFTT